MGPPVDRVIALVKLVNEINGVVAGVELPVVHTALALTVVSAIYSAGHDKANRRAIADAFYADLLTYLEREDIRDWIADAMHPIPPGGRGVQ